MPNTTAFEGRELELIEHFVSVLTTGLDVPKDRLCWEAPGQPGTYITREIWDSLTPDTQWLIALTGSLHVEVLNAQAEAGAEGVWSA